MTRAEVELRGDRYLLTVEGHAEGSVAVCAAVSAIVYALSGYVFNAAGHVKALECNELRSGRARIECTADASVGAAFRMAGIGLTQVARAYPLFLDARYREEGFRP